MSCDSKPQNRVAKTGHSRLTQGWFGRFAKLREIPEARPNLAEFSASNRG